VRPGLASRPSPPLGDKLHAAPVAPPKPLVSSPARPVKAASPPIDDAVTTQLDLGAIEATSFDATATLRESADDDLTAESPLAAMVDEAMSTLRKDRAAAASEPAHEETTAQRMPAISPERAAEFDAIAARLPALPLFAEFTADQIRTVARQAGVLHFQAGDNLTEAGAPEGPMYVLVEGEARIGVAGDESRTQSLIAGDFVGEMSALFGGPRMATVMAGGHVEAVAFAPSMVRWMVNAIPSFGEAVHEAILDRMRTSLPHLAPMFRLLDAPQRKEAFAPFEFATLEAGDALVREGEITDALYVVGAGEVELYGGHGGAARPVRARQGEVVGLASIHGEEPATATVRASRRTIVAMISRTKYPAWIAKHPKLAQAVGDVGTLGRGVLC
jgi:CRP-like cAMP-binding protein